MWLYKATGNREYLDDAKKFEPLMSSSEWSFSWNSKISGASILLYEATGDSTYLSRVTGVLDDFKFGRNKVVITPGKLSFRSTVGTLRHAANMAFIALWLSEIDDCYADYNSFAKGQIHYILGDNPANRSYVVGFGNNPPQRPWHIASACPLSLKEPCDRTNIEATTPNPNILHGALVSGPDSADQFIDKRKSSQLKVSVHYNAGFQSAIGGLEHLRLHGKLP